MPRKYKELWFADRKRKTAQDAYSAKKNENNSINNSFWLCGQSANLLGPHYHMKRNIEKKNCRSKQNVVASSVNHSNLIDIHFKGN